MKPRLLVDAAVLDGTARALPLQWLQGFELQSYSPKNLASVGPDARVQALLLRSVTKLMAPDLRLFPKLQGVATLSSGTDHIDTAALDRAGIALHTGHGGNAVAVTDWVQWALTRSGRRLAGLRVAVVGVGAVGSLVAERLRNQGTVVLACDPPRAQSESNFDSTDLDVLLEAGVDAVTLHVPLTRDGPHRTANLLTTGRLQLLVGGLVLNAARGEVLDAQGAAQLRKQGALSWLAIDTFAGEPHPDPAVLAHCDLATPHIAGHSLEGKRDVAQHAVAGLCRQFGLLGPLVAVDPPRAAEWSPLDAAAAALKADGSRFETLRHAHTRHQCCP